MPARVLLALALVGASSFGASALAPSCGGVRATIVGTGKDDVLKGTSGRDVISGGRGNDVLRGLRGDDVLCGGEGNDDLAAGPGSDVLDGAAGVDALFGAAGDDRLAGGDGNGDLLVGGSENDELDGGPGYLDVVVYAFSAAGVQVDLETGQGAGEGFDTVTGVEQVVGSELSDRLTGGPASDVLVGGVGQDALFGGGGEDRLLGGPDDDQLDGGEGDDEASFEAAQAGVQADVVAARATGEGTDLLASVLDLTGSAFADTLTGDDNANRITGGLGDDSLVGQGGDDDLFGGGGNDRLQGGAGTDTCSEGTAAECERSIIVDYLFFSTIDTPHHGEVRTGLTRVNGSAGGGLGGPVDDVSVGIRRLTTDGCRWWDGGRLVRRSCENPRWLATTFNGGEAGAGPWSYRVRGKLPPGLYEVRVLVYLEPFARDRRPSFEAERIEFRIAA